MRLEFVQRLLSVICLWHRLTQNLLHGCLSNFSPSAIPLGLFEILKKMCVCVFVCLFVFLFLMNIFRTVWEQKFKNTLPANHIRNFQTPPKFYSQWSSQNYVWDFLNFENWNFNDFFFVFVNMGPKGSEISKRYSYKSQRKVFKLVLNVLPNGPFFKFWVWDFYRFFFFFLKISNLPKETKNVN